MSHWDDAIRDLHAFNTLWTQVEKKPNDAVVVRKCVNAVYKSLTLQVWAMKHVDATTLARLKAANRAVTLVAKDRASTVDAMRVALDQWRTAAQETLDSAAPERFSYEGFTILNPERYADAMCRNALAGIDALNAFFKKRGVVHVLEGAIAHVLLGGEDIGGHAYFDSGKRILALNVPELAKTGTGRFMDSFVTETVIHEIGHFIHRNYLKGEAAAAWDTPWRGIPSLADPHYRLVHDDASRKKQLDPLEIPTEYGKVDKFEDFAETFMVFMVAPEKLSPTARFRMQQALSLSGLYGKPVMRLSTSDRSVSIRVAARYSAAVALAAFRARP